MVQGHVVVAQSLAVEVAAVDALQRVEGFAVHAHGGALLGQQGQAVGRTRAVAYLLRQGDAAVDVDHGRVVLVGFVFLEDVEVDIVAALRIASLLK